LLSGAADLQVTLRDGTTLEVDLGTAETIGDVLAALNTANPAKLQAAISADGDRLELTDLTSGSGSFAVASAAGSTAADDLGLTNPTLAGGVTGRRLQAGLKTTLLASLNGGKGLGSLGTLQLTDRAGDTATVDLLDAETIDDVLAAINAAGVGIRATLNTARSGIELTDTSGGSKGNFIVASGDESNTAEKLGIAVNADVGQVDSRSLARQTVSRSTRLADFAGGVSLGSFRIRDSSGKEAAIRLNNPDGPITTVGGVIDAINALDIAVEARLNDRGDGILLVDRGDGTTSLLVTDVGNGTAAADLRLTGTPSPLTVDGQVRQAIDGTTLETFDIARQLSLSAIGEHGVELGKFTIRDSTGKTAVIDLAQTGKEAHTIGDVIDAINAADVAVEARVNDTGDGLLLVDRAGGTSTLTVTDDAKTTTARDLGIAKAATLEAADKSQTVAGGNKVLAKAAGFGPVTQFIDGAGTFSSSDVDAATLARIVEDINGRHAGVAATTFFDGTGYRLSLSGVETGEGRELLVESDNDALRFAEVSQAQDALLHFGLGSQGGILIASKTNEFVNVVDGVNVTIKAASEAPVTISVSATAEKLLGAAEQFVNAYNSLRKTITEVTSFDEEDGAKGILFGTHEVLTIETGLANLVTKHYAGQERFQSLAQLGFELNDKGELSLDRSRLQEAFDRDPAALEKFFADEEQGVAAQFDALIDQLAGEENSTLTSRAESLTEKIDTNSRRIEDMNVRLESERQRLLKQFFAMEDVVARMQADLAAIQGIQALAPLSVSLGQRGR
jgi:flagellar hook-associated protein 2